MNDRETIAQLQRSIQQQPDDARAYKDLGNALQTLSKLDEAKRAYLVAVQIDPDFVAADANIGNIYYLQGELDRAVEFYERAIGRQEEIRQDSGVTPPLLLPGIYANLGNVRHQQGLLESAVACWQQALTLDPNFGSGQLHWKLGNLLLNLGRYGEAIAGYEQLISFGDPPQPPLEKGGQDRNHHPDRLAKLYSNLGTARLYDGQIEGAIAAFNQALEIQPDLVELQCNLGLAVGRLASASPDPLLAIDRFEQAANYFLRSLSLNPNLVEAHRGLFELIRTFQPSNWDLSSVRQVADRYYDFCSPSAQILAATAVAIAYLKSGNAEVANQVLLKIEQKLSLEPENQCDRHCIDLFYSSMLFCFSRLRDNLAANSRISQLIGSQFSQYLSGRDTAMPCPVDREAKPRNQGDRPLKIGFISAHFRRHSVGWCSADIIAALSQITPHIYLYQTEDGKSDDKTEQFKQISAKFYPPCQSKSENNSLKIIESIQNDKLDVLIDLDSLTIPIHADILHARPAPVCISWLGFDAPFISEQNYFLSDRHSHPSGVERYYREQLLRMPDSWVAVSGFASEPVKFPVQRQAMRIDLDQVVYLCVAPATKLNPELAQAQVKILKQVPNSILLYKGIGDPQVIRSVYQAACAAERVSFHRIKFLSRNRTEEEHRTIYQIADVLLDSYPYNGGTHNLEALWFNLPIVTRFGEQFLARMGYSFLNTLGISQGLASSWDEYVAWGIKFGQDVNLRNQIRHQLQIAKTPENLSPLWNPQKFAQDMCQILKNVSC